MLIVHKNTVGGEIWCSFLSTHAFLLGNGQTYATRGVPYFRVSRIFMSRIFHSCNLVPKIHVSHFPPLHYGAAFSCPTISCLAFSASPQILLSGLCYRRYGGQMSAMVILGGHVSEKGANAQQALRINAVTILIV